MAPLFIGGAIGNSCFFYVSGYLLSFKPEKYRGQWLVNKYVRIMPSVWIFSIVMLAAIMAFVFHARFGMDFTILHGGGWFVTCIMIYYVFLYFIKRYFVNYLKWVFAAVCLIVLGWYFTEDSSEIFMYGATYFKWCHYFLFMLAGAVCGLRMKENGNVVSSTKGNLGLLFVSLISFYGLQMAGTKNALIAHFQVLTLIPLMGITLSRVC